MTFFQTYGKEIAALLAPVVTWVLKTVFKAKVKLQVALPHQWTFLVQQPLLNAQGVQVSPTQTAKTNSFIIRNAGRKAATKLQLVFNWKPMCINIWPLRHYDEPIQQDGRYVMIFDSLAPDEVLYVEVLSVNADLPGLTTVRSAECTAQNITMYPQPVASKALLIVIYILLGLGLAAAVYLSILLVQFLFFRTT
jgi:hypothetical protein